MLSLLIQHPGRQSSFCTHALLTLSLLALSLHAAHAQVAFVGDATTENFGSQSIGSSSATQSLSFAVASGTTIASVAVVTTGIPNLDFASVAGTTCVAQKYLSPTSCVVNLTFTPMAAGSRMGAVLFFSKSNGAGTVLGSAPIYGTGMGPQIAFSPGVVSAIDRPEYGTGLLNPVAAVTDAAGNLFVLDTVGHPPSYRLVRIPAAGGVTTTTLPAANGETLYLPSCIAIDGAGNLFIGDFYGRIVEIPTGGGAATAIYPSANGIALIDPSGLAVDGAGDLFVSDFLNNRVLELPASGAAPIAINPTVNSIPLSDPHGLAIDSAGDLFIADLANDRVVELPAGGGAALAFAPTVNGESLHNPVSVAVDAAGDLFIGDNVNHRVVEIPAGGAAPTAIDPTTISPGMGDVYNVTVDAAGDLFLVQETVPGGTRSLEEIEHAQPAPAPFPSPTFLNATDTADGTQTLQAVNIGNQPLALTAVNYPTDFSEPAGDANDCSSSTTLNPGQQCDLPIDFTPINAGALSESLTIADNTLNAPATQHSIAVSGTGIVETMLTSPVPGSTLSGKDVTFTWSAVPGATQYYLWVGTTGVGSKNIMNSGFRTVTSWSVNGLPTNGIPVYARLATYYGSIVMYVDYTFTASTPSEWIPAPAVPCLGKSASGSKDHLPPVQRMGDSSLISPARGQAACPVKGQLLSSDEKAASSVQLPATGRGASR